MLGPVSASVRSRILADISSVRDGVVVVCADGLHVELAWTSRGAELRRKWHGIPPGILYAEIPDVFAYMIGKTMDSVQTHDQFAYLVFTTGEAIRFDWKTAQPKAVGIDVFLALPSDVRVGALGL